MNCTSNCFRTNSILQIWPPANTGCFRPQKMLQGRDVAPMKKWYRKLRCILKPKTHRSLKKHRIVKEALESVYHPGRRLCRWIKQHFASKLLFLLVRPGTYWEMCDLSVYQNRWHIISLLVATTITRKTEINRGIKQPTNSSVSYFRVKLLYVFPSLPCRWGNVTDYRLNYAKIEVTLFSLYQIYSRKLRENILKQYRLNLFKMALYLLQNFPIVFLF